MVGRKVGMPKIAKELGALAVGRLKVPGWHAVGGVAGLGNHGPAVIPQTEGEMAADEAVGAKDQDLPCGH